MPEQGHQRFFIEDRPALDYEVTIFNHPLGLSVTDKVRVTRYGAQVLLKTFGQFHWADVFRMMEVLDGVEPHVLERSASDDENPYSIHIAKVSGNLPKITRAMMESQPSFMDNVAWPKIPKGWL